MLIGLGLDIQRISALERAEALLSPGAFFTDAECRHIHAAPSPMATMAGLFSAKEAVFKALPEQNAGYWTDIEIVRDGRGAPGVALHGGLGQLRVRLGFETKLSISHGEDYACAVAVLEASPVPQNESDR